MSAYNVVRIRVKPGKEDEFVGFYQELKAELPGMRKLTLIKTGDRAYCVVGEWESIDSIINARPALAGRLDSMRSMLEDLGGGLGVTDPVSGEAVVEHFNR